MIVVRIEWQEKRVEVELGNPRRLLEVLREASVPIRSDCGGLGICGKCKVLIRGPGALSPPTEREIKVLSNEEVKRGIRLACQVVIMGGDVTVSIPQDSVVRRYRSADIGLERPVELMPYLRKMLVVAPSPSLNDVRADLERVLESSKLKDFEDLDVDLGSITNLAERLRAGEWTVTLVLWKNKLLDIEAGDTTKHMYGIAVDVGTSKIVAHLVDLTSGETLAVTSAPNPQTSYGADIISRIAYAVRNEENLRELRSLVIGVINNLISIAAREAGISKDYIYETIVVGNTAMHHIFLGLTPKYLAKAPYVPVVRRGVYALAKDLGIDINRRGILYAPPVVAGFVGSDALADAIAVGLDECNEPCMLVDIGTNTEILLSTGKELYACSSPAGPAFEGFATAFGMAASIGAIDQVFIYFDKAAGDYEVRYSVIGEVRPRGICGSAFIDVLANLRRLNVIDSRGKFVSGVKSRRIIEGEGYKGFVIAWSAESAEGRDIVVYSKDINEILLAKAAVASGIRVLLHEAGLSAGALRRVYVAGSFGTYLNVENAVSIGLLPNIDAERFVFVGNAAIVGAKIILKNADVRKRAEALAKKIRYVELSAHPKFKQALLESLEVRPMG